MKKMLTVIVFMSLAVVPAMAAAKYAAVGINEANIRGCAGTKCAVKWKAWKNTPLSMLAVSKDKKWVQVKDFEGHTGWIYYTSLSTDAGVSSKTDVNVRSSASATASIVCTVEKGYAFKFLSKKNGWYEVTDAESPACKGWVYGANVWAPKAAGV